MKNASESQLMSNYLLYSEWYKCLQKMEKMPDPNATEERLYCPRTFDGWSCWNDTPAGTVANVSCPSFITGFAPQRFGYKTCNPDGKWFRHPDTNISWSNYTTCVDIEDLRMRRIVNHIFVAGYSVSIIALVISLAIFFHFRSLRCTRFRIHKNLFVSFVINNALWIVWYREVIDKTEYVVISNEVGCQILHILVYYFLLSSYFWMFCEGIYLHTLLSMAFVSEDRIMRWFYLVGWGIPVLFMAIYGTIRGNSEVESRYCWMDESHYSWILSAPVCISLLINYIFLINIVRVLVTKLRSNLFSHDVIGTKKAVKATLILIPLLGLHYILTPFRPEEGSSGEHVYHVVSAIVSSTQGFFVALLFCFCNTEVNSAVRKKWRYLRFMHERRGLSSSTACAFSINGLNTVSPALRRTTLNKTYLKNNLVKRTTHEPAPERTVKGCVLSLSMNGLNQNNNKTELYEMKNTARDKWSMKQFIHSVDEDELVSDNSPKNTNILGRKYSLDETKLISAKRNSLKFTNNFVNNASIV